MLDLLGQSQNRLGCNRKWPKMEMGDKTKLKFKVKARGALEFKGDERE